MRRFRAIAALAVLGLVSGLATNAGATEATRHTARSDRANATNWQARNNFLAGVPDSALQLPPNLRATRVMAGPGKAPTSDFSSAPRPRPGLRDVRGSSIADNASRSYNRFCDNMTAKVWNEPNGKRLSFDLHGKPGIAIAIPVH